MILKSPMQNAVVIQQTLYSGVFLAEIVAKHH